ncbi:MAG: hypothetical protein LBV41_06060 [Cytophagaceae bacterium]|jgi:hypothetical protein|nr:hypothetical protein [Cytophagaceae bacterium]
MSIKKVISLTFLVLASMVMLVHLFIPHHHHSQNSVAVCTNHHEDTDADNHCQDAVDDCFMQQAYVKNMEDNRLTFQTPDFALTLCYLSLFAENLILPIDDDCLPFKQKPFSPLFYTDYVSQSIGLRAPPACWFYLNCDLL